jgi:heat shock protein HtpX
MTRILLFLATNIAVLAVLNISMRILGIESLLDEQGVGLDIQNLE